MNTENLKLCDRRIPFLHRLWLEEMDGCSVAVVFRNLNGRNSLARAAARSLLKTVHWTVFRAFRTHGACSLSIDLRPDEISATGGHRLFAPNQRFGQLLNNLKTEPVCGRKWVICLYWRKRRGMMLKKRQLIQYTGGFDDDVCADPGMPVPDGIVPDEGK